MGSITRMSPIDEFPADSDLDLMLVVNGSTVTKDPIDELYRGIAIEAGVRGVDEYSSPEIVLANPEIADHIAAGAVISDPLGLLASVQPLVARDFAQRRWVVARCDAQKDRFEMYLSLARSASQPVEFLLHTIFVVQILACLPAIASLVPPTHRKSLVLLRQHLVGRNRPDVYEKALEAAGVGDLSNSRVEWYASEVSRAFDRALEVKRTPSPFDFKLRAHLRPYAIGGLWSMIAEGNHREAMPWIAAGVVVCVLALLNDAPDDEKSQYSALLQGLLDDLGVASHDARGARLALITAVREEIYAVADDIVAGRPDELVTA